MNAHYFFILLIIALIVAWQIRSYNETRRKMSVLGSIFPIQEDDYSLESYSSGEPVISTYHQNVVLNVILDSINDYLFKNKGAISDFHLIKDIVERNCDAKTDEIDTEIPVPLYLGLVGTMAGILLGVGFLVFSDGLAALLRGGEGDGAAGIETLLGGVAIAMIASILGILLTTFGASQAKICKLELEENKNTFLSWIQTNLLPKLSDGVGATMERLTRNLTNFNNTFAQNTIEFHHAISSVTDTYKDLSSVLDAINNLKIGEIAVYNIRVFKELENCKDGIAQFSQYLGSVNEYISNVKSLNDKLDKNETRTQAIEDMGRFFKDEVQQIERRKEYINSAVGKTDDALKLAFDRLLEYANKGMDEFSKALGKQQDALQRRLDETVVLVEELQNLTSLKKSIISLENATKEQNSKFDILIQSIDKLAQKANSKSSSNDSVASIASVTLPRWAKILLIAVGSLISIYCLLYIIPKVQQLFCIIFS